MNASEAIDTADKVVDKLKNIPRPLLFTIISLCLLMVYWFIAIFLFHKDFYNSNPLPISILFSFAFSLTWFILMTLLAVISVAFLDKKDGTNTKIDGVIFISGFISVLYLCLGLLATFILRKKYPLINFNTFLIFSYCYIAFQLVRIAITWLIYKSSKKKPSIIQTPTP